MMNCDGVIRRLGYDCRELSGGIVSVSTPFSFSDGEPIGFYVNERTSAVTVSDNADTLSHFAAVGWEISDRRTWRGIKQTVLNFGFELLDSGEIVGEGSINSIGDLVSRYVCAMLAVVDIEKDFLGTPEELDEYIKEVEMYLRAWKPNSDLTLFASMQGHSGRLHRFHFDLDNTLIDAARPHSNRTGAILRKSADVINSGTQKKIMVVMDDRDDADRAKVETDILSTMVSVMSFTALEKHGVGGNIRYY